MFRATAYSARAFSTIMSSLHSPELTRSMIALASRVRTCFSSPLLGLHFRNAASRAVFISAVVAGANTLDSKRSGIGFSPFGKPDHKTQQNGRYANFDCWAMSKDIESTAQAPTFEVPKKGRFL